MVGQPANVITVVFFLVLVFLFLAALVAFYLHVAGFTLVEVILLVAFPILAFFSSLPLAGINIAGFTGGITGKVLASAKVFDVPVFHSGRVVIGVNAIGFCIPALVTLNMLVHKRIPWKKFCILTLIIAGVTYLYSFFQPGIGMIVYLFAIPPILAAAIAFMFQKMKGSHDINTALLAYAGATIGVLIGADLLNLHKAYDYNWGQPILVSVGGGSVVDALFLAGMVAILADLIFRSQEEKMMEKLTRAIQELWRR
jgi:uncharacterized membrane protein